MGNASFQIYIASSKLEVVSPLCKYMQQPIRRKYEFDPSHLYYRVPRKWILLKRCSGLAALDLVSMSGRLKGFDWSAHGQTPRRHKSIHLSELRTEILLHWKKKIITVSFARDSTVHVLIGTEALVFWIWNVSLLGQKHVFHSGTRGQSLQQKFMNTFFIILQASV